MSRAASLAIVRAVLFAIAFVIGTAAVRGFRATGGVQDFYQPEFGPAVLLACGREFRAPELTRLPELASFLRLQRDSFDCSTLPDTVPVLPSLTTFERISRYLLMSVGVTWRAVGVSWSHLVVFGGLMFAVVACLTYEIARISLGPALGLAATAPLLWSPLAFTVVPHFRDYAKAPFMLAMILVMARLVTGSGRVARVLWLSAIGGMVAGIGLGFRNDVLLTIPPFVFVLFALMPVQTERQFVVRIGAAGLFVVAFAAAGAPVIADYGQGSNSAHVTLLGLMTPFDERLGVEPSVYDVGFAYDDSLAYRTIESFATRAGRGDVVLGTKEYDRAGLAFLADLARITPGDILTRAFAATRQIPVFVLREYLSPPAWLRSRQLRRFYYVRGVVDVRLAPLAPIALAAVVLVAAGVSIRYGLLLLLLAAVFAGGAALQFHERHFFYLEFVPWWAFACLARLAWLSGHKLQDDRPSLFITRATIVRASVFGVVCAAAVAVVLGTTRVYQHRRLRAEFEQYLVAARRPLASSVSHGTRLITTFGIADVGGEHCRVDSVPITIHGHWRRTVEAPVNRVSSEPTHVLFAEYTWDTDREPVTVTVPSESDSCLSKVSAIDASAFPVLLNATLAPGWRTASLHQRLASLWK